MGMCYGVVREFEGLPEPEGFDFIADPPCDNPDDASFLNIVRNAEDTAGLASSFVGEVAATAAVFARCVATVVDRRLNGKTHLLQQLTNPDCDDSDPQLVQAVCEAVYEVNDIGISHG